LGNAVIAPPPELVSSLPLRSRLAELPGIG
jgi:hypothetical protein